MTVASLLGHSRHWRVLNSCHRRSRRSFRRAPLLRLNAEESVEESDAKFLAAGETHEEVDGVIGARENVHYGPEEKFYSELFRSLFHKWSVGVSKKVDVNGDVEREEHDADDVQHHCC